MNSSILSTFIIRYHTNDRFILLPKIDHVNGTNVNSHWDSDFVLGTPKFDHVGVPGTPTFSMSTQTLICVLEGGRENSEILLQM